jgi:hypothetical protein
MYPNAPVGRLGMMIGEYICQATTGFRCVCARAHHKLPLYQQDDIYVYYTITVLWLVFHELT